MSQLDLFGDTPVNNDPRFHEKYCQRFWGDQVEHLGKWKQLHGCVFYIPKQHPDGDPRDGVCSHPKAAEYVKPEYYKEGRHAGAWIPEMKGCPKAAVGAKTFFIAQCRCTDCEKARP